ncbi:MAG: mechanosensitive ion channel family protein [Bacilli bacterium]|nr:mechanosensitive ion channel family protein [Bacilli bacterium]
MDFNEFINNIWVQRSIKVIVAIVVAMILYYILSAIIKKSFNSGKIKVLSDKKNSDAYMHLTINVIRYILMLIVFFVILQVFQIDVTSIVAGVGIFGAVFVLAIQDFFKDITRGSSIISGDYYKVGDIVKYKDMEGKVLYLGLKNTKIQDLRTGNVRSIANRNIEDIEVVSKFVFFNIPLPYELQVLDAEKVVNEAIDNIKALKNVDDASYIGTNELADSSILYQVKIKCNPIEKLQVRRDSIRQILLTLEKHDISVPYNQIDVHNK